MNILESLQWRYATKRMDGRKVDNNKVTDILECIRLSPSSMGLQPYKICVIEDITLREQIYQRACKQAQVVESSHFLVFAARNGVTDEEIEKYIQNIVQTRNVSPDSLNKFKEGLMKLKTKTREEFFNWASRQAYIALGIGLVAAAESGVDATPMEGFEPQIMDKILGLQENGLQSVVLMALGYRNEKEDRLVNAKKVRKPSEDLFVLF